MKTKADRMNIDAVLGGDVTPPVTNTCLVTSHSTSEGRSILNGSA